MGQPRALSGCGSSSPLSVREEEYKVAVVGPEKRAEIICPKAARQAKRSASGHVERGGT